MKRRTHVEACAIALTIDETALLKLATYSENRRLGLSATGNCDVALGPERKLTP
jgi:hypothetical protein